MLFTSIFQHSQPTFIVGFFLSFKTTSQVTYFFACDSSAQTQSPLVVKPFASQSLYLAGSNLCQ